MRGCRMAIEWLPVIREQRIGALSGNFFFFGTCVRCFMPRELQRRAERQNYSIVTWHGKFRPSTCSRLFPTWPLRQLTNGPSSYRTIRPNSPSVPRLRCIETGYGRISKIAPRQPKSAKGGNGVCRERTLIGEGEKKRTERGKERAREGR